MSNSNTSPIDDIIESEVHVSQPVWDLGFKSDDWLSVNCISEEVDNEKVESNRKSNNQTLIYLENPKIDDDISPASSITLDSNHVDKKIYSPVNDRVGSFNIPSNSPHLNLKEKSDMNNHIIKSVRYSSVKPAITIVTHNSAKISTGHNNEIANVSEDQYEFPTRLESSTEFHLDDPNYDDYDRFVSLLEVKKSKKIGFTRETPELSKSDGNLLRKIKTPSNRVLSNTKYDKSKSKEYVNEIKRHGKTDELNKLRALMVEPTVRKAVLATPVGSKPDVLLQLLKKFMPYSSKSRELPARPPSPPSPLKASALTPQPSSFNPQWVTQNSIPLSLKFDIPPQYPRLSTNTVNMPLEFIDHVFNLGSRTTMIHPETHSLRFEASVIYDKLAQEKCASLLSKLPLGRSELIQVVSSQNTSNDTTKQGNVHLGLPDFISRRIGNMKATKCPDVLCTFSSNILASFKRRFSVETICLAYDFHMQLIGAYVADYTKDKSPFKSRQLPGLYLDLTQHKHKYFNKTTIAPKGAATTDTDIRKVKESSYSIDNMFPAMDTNANSAMPTGNPTLSSSTEVATTATTAAPKKPELCQEKLLFFQINFNELPGNVFAIVPVVLDESLAGQMSERELSDVCSTFQEIDLRLSTHLTPLPHPLSSSSFQSNTITTNFPGTHVDDNLPTDTVPIAISSSLDIPGDKIEATPSTIGNPLLQIDVNSNINQYEYNNSYCNNFMMHETAIPSSPMSPNSHLLQQNEPSYEEVEVLHCSRVLSLEKPTGLTESPPNLRKTHFGPGSGVIPFALFRRQSPSLGWALKHIAAVVDTVHPLHYLVSEVTATLARHHILPLPIFHIEHCCDCQAHAMTTKHIPGSYEDSALEIRRAIGLRLPPALVFSNEFSVSPKPRLGSFEVTVQPYYSHISHELYSKTSRGGFPTANEIVEQAASLLLPERIVFSKSASLKLNLQDSYFRGPVRNAQIQLYRINIGVTLPYPLESVLTTNHFKNDPPLEIYVTEDSMTRQRSRPATASYRYRYRSTSPTNAASSSATSLLLRSKGVKECMLRRSMRFFNIRTWGKKDVTKWFMSFEVPIKVLENAVAAGVVDGASFADLVNPASIHSWGVRSKVVLAKMSLSLQALDYRFSEDERTHGWSKKIVSIQRSMEPTKIDAFDPYVATGFESEEHSSIPSPHGISSSSGNIVSYELESDGATDYAGNAQLNIHNSGTYIFTAFKADKEPYCSLPFQVDFKNKEWTYCAFMKPLLCGVTITVTSPHRTVAWDRIWERVPLGWNLGVLLSFLSLTTGKRYFAIARPVESRRSSITTSSMDLDANKELQSSINKTLQVLRGLEDADGVSTLQSIENIMLTTASRRQSKIGRGPKGDSNSTPVDNSRQSSTVKRVVLWLPAARYRCEVTGEEFDIPTTVPESNEKKEDVDPEEVTATKSHQGLHVSRVRRLPAPAGGNKKKFASTEDITKLKRTKIENLSLNFDADSAYTCHRKHILKLVLFLQRKFRERRLTFLKKNSKYLDVIRIGLKQYLFRVRKKIRRRSINKLQVWAKGEVLKLRFYKTKLGFVSLQCAVRCRIAVRKVDRMRRCRRALQHAFAYCIVKRRKERLAALTIQCAYRSYKAVLKYKYLRFKRQWRLLSRESAERGRQKLEFHQREEKRLKQLRIEQLAEEEERKKIQMKKQRQLRAQQIEEELRCHRAAVTIQNFFRRQPIQSKYCKLIKKLKALKESEAAQAAQLSMDRANNHNYNYHYQDGDGVGQISSSGTKDSVFRTTSYDADHSRKRNVSSAGEDALLPSSSSHRSPPSASTSSSSNHPVRRRSYDFLLEIMGRRAVPMQRLVRAFLAKIEYNKKMLARGGRTSSILPLRTLRVIATLSNNSTSLNSDHVDEDSSINKLKTSPITNNEDSDSKDISSKRRQKLPYMFRSSDPNNDSDISNMNSIDQCDSETASDYDIYEKAKLKAVFDLLGFGTPPTKPASRRVSICNEPTIYTMKSEEDYEDDDDDDRSESIGEQRPKHMKFSRKGSHHHILEGRVEEDEDNESNHSKEEFEANEKERLHKLEIQEVVDKQTLMLQLEERFRNRYEALKEITFASMRATYLPLYPVPKMSLSRSSSQRYMSVTRGGSIDENMFTKGLPNDKDKSYSDLANNILFLKLMRPNSTSHLLQVTKDVNYCNLPIIERQKLIRPRHICNLFDPRNNSESEEEDF